MGTNRATTIFDADDSRLAQAWKRLDRDIQAAQKKFAFLGGVAKAGFAAGAAGGAILGVGIKSALDEGGHLLDLSNQTGIAIDQLAILGQEGKNAGTEIGQVAGAVNKMQKAIASGEADDVLGTLVGSVADFKALSPVEQFQKLGKAIAALPSATDRSAAAMKIFGKSGAELLSMFASGGFGDAASQVGDQASLLARDAALFDDVSDKLNLAGTKVQGFFVGVADQVAPVLKPLVDEIAGLDGAKIGQGVGAGLATALQSIRDGTLADDLGLTISIALAKAVNVLSGGLYSAATTFGATTIEMAKLAGSALVSAMNPSNVAAALIGRGPLSGAAISDQIAASIAKVQAAASSGFKEGQLIDVGAMEALLEANLVKAIGGAQDAQAKALADLPTVAPTGGPAELSLGTGGADKLPDVTALQKVGGAFGAPGGSDPWIEANRLSGEGNNILRNILGALTGGDASTVIREAAYA